MDFTCSTTPTWSSPTRPQRTRSAWTACDPPPAPGVRPSPAPRVQPVPEGPSRPGGSVLEGAAAPCLLLPCTLSTKPQLVVLSLPRSRAPSPWRQRCHPRAARCRPAVKELFLSWFSIGLFLSRAPLPLSPQAELQQDPVFALEKGFGQLRKGRRCWQTEPGAEGLSPLLSPGLGGQSLRCHLPPGIVTLLCDTVIPPGAVLVPRYVPTLLSLPPAPAVPAKRSRRAPKSSSNTIFFPKLFMGFVLFLFCF